MPRYIDVDALEKEAGKLWSEMPDGEELSKELMKAINHAPAVDAAPVVHGHWEEPEREGVWQWDKRAYAQCSVCKKKSYLGWKDNWCRYCGAKMDLEGLNAEKED